MEKITAGKQFGKSKIENSAGFSEIKRVYAEFLPDVQHGVLSIRNLYISYILPVVPSDESISYQNFLNWHKSQSAKRDTVIFGKSMMEREMDKTKQQIEIRQDATELMSKFIKGLRELAEDPEALRNSGISIKDLYKIIREEEDRNKLIGLKERSENRADAQFAFMVSMARAGQITDEDIAFLEDDLKHELIDLKKSHGIYQLPTANAMAEVPSTAEALASVADEGDQEGSY